MKYKVFTDPRDCIMVMQDFLNTGLVNSDLRWEKSTTTDIGVDIGILKNRITIIFDYYDRKTSDLLTNLALLAIQDMVQ
jgi:hypothetical protein